MAIKAQKIINDELQNMQQFIANKNYTEAEKKAQILIKHDPSNAKVFEAMGDMYFKQRKYKKSVWYYLSAAEKNDQNYELLTKLAENLFFINSFEKSILIINKVFEMKPDYSYAYVISGLNKQEMGNDDEAIMAYEDAININPNEVLAYLNLGLLYKKNKKFEDAIKVYQQAIVHNPGNHFILSNLGNLFYLQKKFDDAFLCHQRAIKSKPDSPILYYNYANTLLHAGKYDESNKIYKKAIEVDPSFARAHVNLGSNYLSKKNFEDGFKEYSWRIYFDELLDIDAKKNKKIWKGEEIKGKNILVCAETGYGNIIQFSRYLSILKQYECNIIFSCPDDLHHLFLGQDYVDQIISTNDTFNDYEYWIPLQSLIPLLTPDPSESCPMPSILNVNDNKLIEWETLLGVDNKIKIGICWQGSTKNARDHLNSIDLALFKDIVKIENTAFISLQKGHGHHQIAKNKLSEYIVDYDMLMDSGSQRFIDSTAIIKYLDLVITTDTSIAHLAGSLGTQTWVLLPKLCDWRWFEDVDETIWYENVRLFRQEKAGDWENLLKKVHDETLNLSKNLFEIRKEQEAINVQEDEAEEPTPSVTDDIELENDENTQLASAEDLHNEGIEPSYETSETSYDSVETPPEYNENEATQTPEDTNEQIETVQENTLEENTPEQLSENTNYETPEYETPEIENIEETIENPVEENVNHDTSLETENQIQEDETPPQNEETDDGAIVPRVLRDDDGGEKIKFKR